MSSIFDLGPARRLGRHRRSLLLSCATASLSLGLGLGCGSDESPTTGAGGTSPKAGGAAGASGAATVGGGMMPGGTGGTAGGASAGSAPLGGTSMAGGTNGGAGGQGGASGSGGAMAGAGGGVSQSSGCGKEPELESGTIMVQSSQKNRSYVLRLPDDYDRDHPYRLILGFHGATGNANQVAPQFFGLWGLAQGSAIFIAANGLQQGGSPGTSNLFWYNEDGEDLTYIDDILEQVEAALCIDKKKIALEGFSMGGAMVWTAACARPGVFSAAVVHSGGGQPRPASCAPMPFMSSLGAQESNGAGQTSNSDFFAMQMGCTVQPLPKAPDGGHACSNYPGCPATSPVRWCDYDAGHLPDPRDAGESASWMPEEVWQFLSQF